MQLFHSPPVASAVFDEPNLVSFAGLVPVMAIARRAGLARLADTWLSVPTDNGANAGLKVCSLVAGMAAGADSIDDLGVLRHGAMDRVLGRSYAPSTLGSFLRAMKFGHVRQLDAVASRFLTALAADTRVLGAPEDRSPVMVDLDDTIVEVHGYQKQGAAFGYSHIRGINAILATVSTDTVAPVVVAQRLRKGNCGSPRGVTRLIRDALATTRRTHLAGRNVLVRADSAFYCRALVGPALKAGADVSVTVRMNPVVKRAIAAISENTWTTIKYPHAIWDEASRTWISKAQVAEIPFTAFSSRKAPDQVPGRLVVRRIPDLNVRAAHGQATLFETWRFHAFFTTTDLDTVAADQTHRRHAIIENVHADLKASALAHLPSGAFTANAAWLVCAVMAFNLTRAAATITGPGFARSTTATIRRKLIQIPARLATSARRLRLHLPAGWLWSEEGTELFQHACGPPATATT